ncbi:MAG: hypothetical protein NZ898_14210 [Myxococcota bacterium]|nr:hypothetical protein [Myxococcota bacterium]MDW8362211.1 hypothetical protein [Myxococcales bacterium]
MTSVRGVGGPGGPQLQSLTAEQILVMAASVTKSLDQQAQRILNGIQTRAAQADEVSSYIGALQRLSQVARSHPDNTVRVGRDLRPDSRETRIPGMNSLTDALGDRAVRDALSSGNREEFVRLMEHYGIRYDESAQEMFDFATGLLEGRSYEEAKAILEKIERAAGSDGQLKADEIDRLIQEERERLNRINSGNETETMQLQSIVQQRSQSLQMLSNILQSVHSTHNAMVGNMRG